MGKCSHIMSPLIPLLLKSDKQLNGNKIIDLRDLESQLSSISTLATLYLEGNPCQDAEGASYRRKVMIALPQLLQIYATFVTLLPILVYLY